MTDPDPTTDIETATEPDPADIGMDPLELEDLPEGKPSEIALLAKEVGLLRGSVNRRTKWVIAAVVTAIAFGVVGGIYGWTGRNTANDAKAALRAQRVETAARRLDTCKRDNVARAAQRLSASTSATSASNLATVLLNGHEVTPAIQAQLDKFNEKVVAPFLALASPAGPFADRDCSPETLAKVP